MTTREKYQKIAKKILSIGAGAYFTIASFGANGQTVQHNNLESKVHQTSRSKIERGLQAAKQIGKNKTYMIYEFPFNNELKTAIKKSKDPILYSSDRNTKVKFNSDSTALELYYPKKYFNQEGEGKTIGITIRDGKKPDNCSDLGLGSKYNHLPSIYWAPKIVKEAEGQSSTNEQNAKNEKGIINNIKNITNNYYFRDTTNTKTDTIFQLPKKESNKLREIIEAGINKNGRNYFVGSAIQAPLSKKGNTYLGLYGEKYFGETKSSTIKDYQITTPINNNISINTSGFEKTETTKTPVFETGAIISQDIKRLSVDALFGINQINYETKKTNKGINREEYSGKIVSEKNFCNEVKSKNKKIESIAGIGVRYSPVNNFGIGVRAKANNLFGKPKLSLEATLNFIFGGRKRK